ncbi:MULTISPECIES: glycogen synthase GlgA [unclassified Aureimonas]|uniref:glycogen synthase GlgA n=1 Tax=unclassified Aureimonas TaxID=2615206 RepID=UPI0006F7D753|nr:MULTISPECIES: glycogen synthase GlgA [unclassified Aureimonas]KQT69722.1 glycogen synthase [Aureimonas sp. Leaf427]KQT76126.1 glycogen synthase [Aureimonas sp. Leaf460]
MKVLSVASEVYPFVKTGGLADVAGALPLALTERGKEVKTLLPLYPEVAAAIPLGDGEPVLALEDLFGGPARIHAATAAGLDLLLIDAPHLYDRPGGPYLTTAGQEHLDNWARFAALGRVGAMIGQGATGWQPDILHAHDWQAALAPVYLSFSAGPRPKTVLTIHNLAFQGNYPREILPGLNLPSSAWSLEGLEYYGSVGFLKGGLHAADAVTTVSPTYAEEIVTPEGGMGLDGLLRGRSSRLVGIVNGIDTAVWDPASDPLIDTRYGAKTLKTRAANKRAIEAEFGLAPGEGPIFAVVSRLTWQKGMDVLAGLTEEIVALGARLAIIGSGEPLIEGAFLAAHARHPGQVGVRIGYSEPLSHHLQAGADGLLIPSRFEPCGLTQLYALRYGCIPVVSKVGGLADTVIDANYAAVAAKVATGVIFDTVAPTPLLDAISRACRLYEDAPVWQAMQRRGMATDVGWTASAARYADLYASLLKDAA